MYATVNVLRGESRVKGQKRDLIIFRFLAIFITMCLDEEIDLIIRNGDAFVSLISIIM